MNPSLSGWDNRVKKRIFDIMLTLGGRLRYVAAGNGTRLENTSPSADRGKDLQRLIIMSNILFLSHEISTLQTNLVFSV